MEKLLLLCLHLNILCNLSIGQIAKHSHFRSDIHIVPHAVDLDVVTFNKIITHYNVTVVMFMHFKTYGHDLLEYKNFAESTVTQPEVIAATVGLMDDAERPNMELAERYAIKMEELPVVKLFVGGEEKSTFTGEMTCDKLRQFVKDHSGVWIGRPGAVQYLDKLAANFIRAHSDNQKKELYEQAIQYKDTNLTREDDIKSALYYIRVMDEYRNNGPTFLNSESGRLKKLKAKHKFHHEHLCGVKKELNILQSFQSVAAHTPHDEL